MRVEFLLRFACFSGEITYFGVKCDFFISSPLPIVMKLHISSAEKKCHKDVRLASHFKGRGKVKSNNSYLTLHYTFI